MEIQAFAKLNLTLDVLGKRPDGYHDLRMVMQSITLCDTLTLTSNQGQGLRVSTDLHFLPTGEKNLAAIAARRFWEALGCPAEDLDICIRKRIPVCAGMAGGSTDAAAVLRALNQRAGSPLTPAELARVGEQVGSDVPYCVLGGTALAEGRGERLTPLPALPRCWVVVCKPEFAISTPELFARIDSVRLRCRPDTDGLLSALEAHLEELAAAGQVAVTEAGRSEPVTARLERCWFPTKEYDGFALPAGEYTALRVVIGAGQGQNWWCVAFPPLCLEAASETVDEAAAAGYFSPGQAALITEEDRGYVLKFKAMELLGEWKGLLCR